MEYDLKAGPQGHIYFPKKIREYLGNELKLVLNSIAGVLYPKDANLQQVILSLQLTIQQLKLRVEKVNED